MAEAIQERVETASGAKAVGFEPQVLAFCCEH